MEREKQKTRSTAEKIRLVRKCFHGLENVYGTYDPKTGRTWQVKANVTDRVVYEHLTGRKPLGVYLLVGEITFAAVADFDFLDTGPPLELMDRLSRWGAASYLEASKSRGNHVWVFFDKDGVPAVKVRRVFLSLLGDIGYPKVEVFPKQDSIDLEAGQCGNFIHSPLFGKSVAKGKNVFLDRDRALQPYENQWDLLESIRTTSEEALDQYLQKNGNPGPQVSAQPNSNVIATFGNAHSLTPCVQRMLSEGVTESQRVACFRLAVALRRIGIDYDLAVTVLQAWKQRNRPQNGRVVLSETEVRTQTASAYQDSYPGHGCEDDAIRPFCSKSCPVYVHTMKT